MLSKPIYGILVMATVVLFLLLIGNVHVKYSLAIFLLLCQSVLLVGMVFLYDSNGTFFEWSMLNQRNDATGTIEDLSLRWGLVAFCICMLLFYVLCVVLIWLLWLRKIKFEKTKWPIKLTTALACLACTALMVVTPAMDAIRASKLSYVDRILYSSGDNKYQQLGITPNAVYELFNGTVANAMVKHDSKGIAEFLDNDGDSALQTSEYFGISANNNLVYILVESFEWYSFLTDCTPEQSAVLFPNLNKLYGECLYADNFYSREKTDTAEMLALVGSNPSDKYINYDFPKNAYPYSLPNLFRQGVEDNGNVVKQVKSFHANTGEFYNRETLHKSFGFEELVSIEDMTDKGVENLWNIKNKVRERNLDSQTIEVMQEEMFPVTEANEQYMTFWITFTMHGYYEKRQVFEREGYYDKLDSVGAYPEGKSKKDDYLRTYACAVMDFDKAIGTMMKRLEDNGQLNTTTIVMFADHNSYYNNLSAHAKGIDKRYDGELYRVPFMIYDTKLIDKYVDQEGTRAISKFTTTADMLPTILDIFGIHGYRNLYFGTSMFVKDVESILYSRAYRIFVTNKLICYSVKDILWKCEGFTDADLQDFISRAKVHLNKLEYIDKIFYNNYFKTTAYEPPNV